MKKQLIATLVAGILLFVWQFLSWAMLNVHGNEMQYTDKQDAILQMLVQQNLKDGTYMLPMPAPGSTPEQQQALMDSSAGKPWASVSYHASFNNNMGMSMFRAFIVDFLAAFLLIWMLLKMANLDFKTALLSSWAVGAICYLTIPYLNSVWYENGTMGYVVDAIVGWGLVGAWLGWYLTKK